MQLFKLAAMLNRTLVLPTSSCESQWLEKWPWPMLGFPDYYDRQVVVSAAAATGELSTGSCPNHARRAVRPAC